MHSVRPQFQSKIQELICKFTHKKNDKPHTLKCAKSSSLVKSNSSKYKEYTSIQPYTFMTVNNAPNKIMVKLQPNMGSLAIEENNQAINLNTVNAANENNQGTIRFSCS